ncbi:MAG: (2Fe-2S) ferredoxin domain-containing protein [Rhodospirillaceae bacterium]|jgi:(2Fe-2S) ferredoxin|nr:(2Fe-2S) ferredoxin domain-containing protein [Rhodospirillaceae bacterium]|tara:strand:- start:2231 stop:2569 length:339 start_codon:yes stop_codon:yes gene_type:complete
MPDQDDPYYRLHVFCCTNVRPESHPRGSCARKTSVQLRDYMKKKAKTMDVGRVRINASGCLDRCELGPTMVIYPDGIWYRYETEADIDEILDSHVKEGQVVERLVLEIEDGP